MNEKIAKFIKENENLIQSQRWEEIYKKDFPVYFTETLLDCGINPLNQGLNYIPHDFLYNCNIKKFTIPDNVTSVGFFAFNRCESLISVIIPSSVTKIEENAFSGCSSLTNIIIPDSVINIEEDTFSDCTSLANVVIGGSVTSIARAAFSYCTSLTSVTIPDSVTSIGGLVFYNCTSLTSVTIPNNITNIGEWAFRYCSSLTHINYLGTKKEAMKLGIGNKSRKKWRVDSAISKIICTDGEIEL